MPTYAFKCPFCKKETEIMMSMGEFLELNNTIMGECSNKKCKSPLLREHQVLNFSGGINMNASSMGISQKKYNNKQGGPVGLSGGKEVGRAKV